MNILKQDFSFTLKVFQLKVFQICVMQITLQTVQLLADISEAIF